MKQIIVVLVCSLISFSTFSQTLEARIANAYARFESDSQLQHAASSLYVIDAATGQVVFDKNSRLGLAPASTQKIITSTSSYELLSPSFSFQTKIGYRDKIDNGILKGDVYVLGSGDPTFGSWRWAQTNDTLVLGNIAKSLRDAGIKKINGNIRFVVNGRPKQGIPDGWIWQDIGNYYGAGAFTLTWKENQYDLFLESENKIGGKVKVMRKNHAVDLDNTLSAAAKNSGDNAYVFYDNSISGTIPLGETNFKISASMQDPAWEFRQDLTGYLNGKRLAISSTNQPLSIITDSIAGLQIAYTHFSPSLDSIIYWFNKRSINLYGEALMKAIGQQAAGWGSTDSGIAVVQRFWKGQGLDIGELNMYDGSGLSPLNRVTTHAQTEILRFAKSRPWFPAFYDALPEYNGMKMKSGTISDVKGFCGYQKSKDGREYIFSFLVNNYSGRASALVAKMYKVLDELK